MRLGVLQPGYLPWLGFFDQLTRCDVFILYDDVLYSKESWRNRNRIKTPGGWCWLTVPVVRKGLNGKPIRDVQVSDQCHWQRDHWRSIRGCYARAPYFDVHAEFFARVYEQPWRFLVDLDLTIIWYLAAALGIQTNILVSSQERLEEEYCRTWQGERDPTGRVAFLCQRLGADCFLEGASGRTFMYPARLKPLGINLEFHDYQHPHYRQLFDGFIPYLSVIDLLFNHGPESLDILAGRRMVCPE